MRSGAPRSLLLNKYLLSSDSQPHHDSPGTRRSSCVCNSSIALPQTDPTKAKLFYHSGLASDDYGSWQIGNLSAVYHKQLPNARVGANFMGIVSAACPGSGFFVGGCAFNYLGNVRQWIKPFREGSLSLPWSEDW